MSILGWAADVPSIDVEERLGPCAISANSAKPRSAAAGCSHCRVTVAWALSYTRARA